MDACEKISALGDDIYGIYQPITFNEFFKVAAQYGGGVLNADKTEFTINSEENGEGRVIVLDLDHPVGVPEKAKDVHSTSFVK